MIRYPNIIGNTDTQKLEQIKSYLYQLADELNYQIDKTSNIGSGYPSSSVGVDSVAKPVKKDDAISNFNDIKALIIKSADIVDAYYEEINKKLEGQYVAESDFGTYKETTQAQLNASSDQIEVILTKQEEIDTDMDDLERTLRSEIEQTAESIKLEVTGGEPGNTASIKLTVGDKSYSGTIDMTGLVTFTNLETAGQTAINGSNITTGEILADRVKAGVIKSKDGESVVIDLDNGVVDVTGNITTQKEQSDVGLRWSKVYPGGLHSEGDWGSSTATSDVQPGYVELNSNGSTISLQSDIYGMGEVSQLFSSNGNYLNAIVNAGRSFITGLTAPITPSDAVNKEYVDGNFAPAGYGLGSSATRVTDLNTALHNGFYHWGSDAVNAPFNPAHGGGSMIVISRDGADYVDQFAFDNVQYPVTMSVRQKVAGGWGEWEWVNPPLKIGTAYRTTKRWNGQAVYQKLIDCGTMPNGSTSAYGRKTVACGISPDKVVNITGYVKKAGEFNPLYQGYAGQLGAYFFITSSGIVCNAMQNLGNEGYTCAVLVEYTE